MTRIKAVNWTKEYYNDTILDEALKDNNHNFNSGPTYVFVIRGNVLVFLSLHFIFV